MTDLRHLEYAVKSLLGPVIPNRSLTCAELLAIIELAKKSRIEERTCQCKTCDVWEKHNGSIPEGFDIHHINGDREDNRLSNLECVSKADHARKYPGRRNQFNKEKKCG